MSRRQFEVLAVPAEHADAIAVLDEELAALNLQPREEAAVKVTGWRTLDELRMMARQALGAAAKS